MNKTIAELVIYLAYQVEHAFGDQDKIDKAIAEATKAIEALITEAYKKGHIDGAISQLKGGK